jgi:hypothetical protein
MTVAIDWTLPIPVTWIGADMAATSSTMTG